MHIPVLAAELIALLDIKPNGIYADATGGGGGHAALLLERLENGRLIVTDRDREAVDRLKTRFAEDKRVSVIKADFQELDAVFESLGVERAHGIYADLGLSSFQLKDPSRGFSFRLEGIIDMRMDRENSLSAQSAVNNLEEGKLEEIITKYGEERMSRRIAKYIVEARREKALESTVELAEIVAKAIPKKFWDKRTHPATKTFQALRIYVNDELKSIEALLSKLERLLEEGARAAFISFHSLEDRLVKEAFRLGANPCVCPPYYPCVCGKTPYFKILTKTPVTPAEDEVKNNPLSRSAKLRVAERI